MRILLADDQATLPATLRLWLELLPGFSLVGVVAEVALLSEAVRRWHPDLLLFDWQLAGVVDGPTRQRLLQQLRLIQPDLRIVALTTEPIGGQSAVHHQVDAFVSKSESPDSLAFVLRRFDPINPERT